VQSSPFPLIVVLILLLVSPVACGGRAEPTGRLTGDELSWVRKLERWESSVEAAGARGEQARDRILGGLGGSRAEFDELMAPVQGCADRFGREVGEAPSSRLGRVAESALAGCREFARAAEAESRAFVEDPGPLLLSSEDALARGNRLWLVADDRLEALLAWNAPLPVLSGAPSESRIEPRLGRVAAMLASRPVQIRCWSEADWPAVFAEWNAYSTGRDIPVGFVASFDRGRVNLAPEICSVLADFLYGAGAPRSETGKLDLADAVVTLAHESEHLVAPAPEAAIECYAAQDVRRTARALGARPGLAAELSRLFWTKLYPQDAPLYRSVLCRDGGPFDRDPESEVWP
jgi:hypothetical protein